MSLTDLAPVAACHSCVQSVSAHCLLWAESLSPSAASSQGVGKSCSPSSNPLWAGSLQGTGNSERQKCTATHQMPTVFTQENATQFPALPGAPGSPSLTGKQAENPEMSALRSPTIPDAWISTSKGVPIWCLDYVICDRRKLGSDIMLSSRPVPREHALPLPQLARSAAVGTMSPDVWAPNGHDRAGVQCSEP